MLCLRTGFLPFHCRACAAGLFGSCAFGSGGILVRARVDSRAFGACGLLVRERLVCAGFWFVSVWFVRAFGSCVFGSCGLLVRARLVRVCVCVFFFGSDTFF